MPDCVPLPKLVSKSEFKKIGYYLFPFLTYIAIFLALYFHRFNDKLEISHEKMANLEKFYQADLGDHHLGHKFVQLEKDDGTKSFIKWSTDRSQKFILQLFYCIAAPILQLFTTKTAANGILHRGEMFVFSSEQFKKLLPVYDSERGDEFKFSHWLDLGAGDGGALERGVKPLAKKISATEICPVMRKRLQWRGFSVEDVNDWSLKSWDMISMLNLLDRAGNPDFFLEQASGALEEGGYLFIAIVLPFRPYVERGGTGERKPLLDVSHYQCNSKKYVDQVGSFVSAVEKWRLELVSWSTVPYLCEGDKTTG